MKKVFLIILNWNGKKMTLECLESLEKLRITNYELRIIVVDNGSADDSVAVVRQKFPKVEVLENHQNLGFAEGNNVGIRYALGKGADYVILLNNDTLVDKNLVKKLLEVAGKDPSVGIFGPKIYFAPGFEFHKDRYKKEERGKVIWFAGGMIDWKNIYGHHRGVDEVDHGQYNQVKEVDSITGCCLGARREVFEKIGRLDPRYFLYYEDLDFCQRAKRAGFKILYIPSAFLWHQNAGSAEGSGSNLQDYYISRNRLLFGLRYAPLRTKLALLRESLFNLFSGRPWQKRGILDFYLGKFGKGNYPIK